MSSTARRAACFTSARPRSHSASDRASRRPAGGRRFPPPRQRWINVSALSSRVMEDALHAVQLLGLELADAGLETVARHLARRPVDAPFGYVVTPNADHFVRLAHRAELAPLYRDALLRLLDSRIVARAARLGGLPAPGVVTGSDLARVILQRHGR